MISNTKSLENMITEVTSPLTTHIDLNAFKKIYDNIKGDPHGPEVALRLLAHKVQSPQEKEALSALVILDLCVENCGSNFHKELGKFKFLNELMKILLPKHLGEVTPPVVRDKCIMLMFAWQRDLGDNYPKVREAYQMLKTLNIVKEDPVIPNEAENDREYTKQMANRTDIFKSSRYKDKLDRLLKSKNPQDLREANAIIRSIVNEENARIEKRSRCALEIETLRNNTNLLEEMLHCAESEGQPSASDVDVMGEIAINIKRARPIIFELALTDGDKEEGFLVDVIEACSRASSILDKYEVVVLHKPPSIVENSTTARQVTSLPPPTASDASSAEPDDLLILSSDTHQDLLSQDLVNLGIDDTKSHQNWSFSNTDLDGLLSTSSKTPGEIVMPPVLPTQSQPLPSVQSTSNYPTPSKVNSNALNPSSDSPSTHSAASMFSELDSMGRQMLGLTNTQSDAKSSDTSSNFGPLNSLLNTSETPTKASDTQRHPESSLSSTLVDIPLLASLPGLTFSAIRPHTQHIQPIWVFPIDKGDDIQDEETARQHQQMVEVVLHCTSNKPHSSVSVLVAVVTNRNALPLTNLLLRFGVEKPLKIRQLPLSTSHLPAFCSFLPPSPAQQIIYIQQPPNLEMKMAKLKFQLSFTLEEEDILESGVVFAPLD